MNKGRKTPLILLKKAVLFLSILGLVFFQNTYATVGLGGTPQTLAYQGRLADANGNLQGGSSGTTFYFKFSIWDSATPPGGTQLWP